jgi:DNA-binding transcriptional MerR regulator
MGIGDLAKETGVKVVTIRYYEQIGVLPVVKRTSGNYRTYGADHVRRLRFVRRCRDLGFSLDQVRGLGSMSDGRAASAGTREENCRPQTACVEIAPNQCVV